MWKAVLGSVVAVSLLATMTPAAIASSIKDPTDARGRLDLTFVSATNDVPGGFIRVRIDTEHGYACPFLSTTTPNRVFVLFDVGNDGDVDDIGRFVCTPDHEWALKMRDVGGIVGRHPDADTLVVNVGWEFISGNQETTHGSIVVRTRDETSRRCRQTTCTDRAPDSGGLAAW